MLLRLEVFHAVLLVILAAAFAAGIWYLAVAELPHLVIQLPTIASIA